VSPGVVPAPACPPAALLERAPELAAVPPGSLRLLLLVNPLLLVTIGALVGAAAAHRVRLGSRLGGTWPVGEGRRESRWVTHAVAAGLLVATILVGLDWLFRPMLGEAALRQLETPPGAAGTIVAVLYGGIAEEVMMRWGVMSAVLWAASSAWRWFARPPDGESPPAVLAWLAIGIAALVFAAGHLPALAAMLEPTPALVARTLVLNAIAGMAYGWLFLTRGLEAAMLAHGATHVGFAMTRVF
jgi:Type II CAAX prenyl endopeptidase Rce1-like